MREQDGIDLIDKVIADKIRKNKGVSGIDGITVYQLKGHMEKYSPELKRNGTYQPQPVKRVAIPKPDGSKRYLGIPCVLDRVIDPHFSDKSFWFSERQKCPSSNKTSRTIL